MTPTPANDDAAPFALNPEGLWAAGALLQRQCHGASLAAGWWTHRETGLDLVKVVTMPETPLERLLAGALVGQKLCLSHSEISEAMEGHRKGLPDDKLPHRPMIEVEIADAVIRLADLAGALQIRSKDGFGVYAFKSELRVALMAPETLGAAA